MKRSEAACVPVYIYFVCTNATQHTLYKVSSSCK